MPVIHATFQNGQFQPTEPVELPEGTKVTIELTLVGDNQKLSPYQQRIRELLSQSDDTGDRSLAERHNEHQP